MWSLFIGLLVETLIALLVVFCHLLCKTKKWLIAEKSLTLVTGWGCFAAKSMGIMSTSPTMENVTLTHWLRYACGVNLPSCFCFSVTALTLAGFSMGYVSQQVIFV